MAVDHNAAELERLRAEVAALREEVARLSHDERLLSALLDTVPDHVYFKDLQSRFTRVSRSQAEMFGLRDPAQAIGKTDADFFAPAHAQQALADERRVIETGKPLVAAEEREVWPGGKESWASTTKVPLRDGQGKVIGTFGISRDITGRKHAQQERERLLSELQAALKRIHTLHGLIPICPQCKRVRDDKGYWQQVEQYMADNSGATFSHCLCEECSAKLYPRFASGEKGDAATA